MVRVETTFPGNDGLVLTVTLKIQKGLIRRPVERLHRPEVKNQPMNAGYDDGDPHGGELLNQMETVKGSTKGKRPSHVVKKSTPILQRRWRGGEDVGARSRYGRRSRPSKRLDL